MEQLFIMKWKYILRLIGEIILAVSAGFGGSALHNASNDYELYQNNTFILGDATKEILTNEGAWYNNNHTFI